MRRSKYRAVPTFVNGIRFASKREANRYRELRLLEKAGKIRNLILQKTFFLEVNKWTVGKYIADFVYEEIVVPGKVVEVVVEDCKGFRTPLYKWKKRHFEVQYNRKIRET